MHERAKLRPSITVRPSQAVGPRLLEAISPSPNRVKSLSRFSEGQTNTIYSNIGSYSVAALSAAYL
jgi:hypothetical protein